MSCKDLYMNRINYFLQSIVYCIVNPIKKVSSMICTIPLFCIKNDFMKKAKNSDEEFNVRKVFRKRLSYSNLNEEFKKELNEVETLLHSTSINNTPSKLILNIDDKTPFIKNNKSKTELREKIDLIENHMYIKCKYCGNEVKDSDVYCMYDKHYCSELCRHRMVYKS